MPRTAGLDAQWATVHAVRHADAKPRPGKHVDTTSPLLSMPTAGDTVEAAERRSAAVKAADLALQHPCELDPTRGVTACQHPDHVRDADLLRTVLDVLALPGHDPYAGDTPATPAPAPPQTAPAAARPDLSWQTRAACRGMDTVLFFGPPGERHHERILREREAAEVCMYCPARDACGEWAFTNFEQAGVWGGMGEDERREERRRWLRRRKQRKANAA